MVRPKPAVEPNAVYSREETAEILGVSLSTLKRLIAEGHLQVSKLNGGRRVFIRGANILTMLDQSTVQNHAPARAKRAAKK
ncbi:MAG TPA: helix-turn-helix domain-containing protein [Anaerolineae bacterium]|nr:helix-turn-helix domain-containing protein [Anaerolineae bacterium]